MPRISAGILVYRFASDGVEFLLVHPGGPFWKNKDAGAWSIPKGEVAPGEELLATAKREFAEELGQSIDGAFRALPPIKQKGGTIVHAFAIEASLDVSAIQSNTFELEWPPRSKTMRTFPEVDTAEYFPLAIALQKINPSQAPLLQAAIER